MSAEFRKGYAAGMIQAANILAMKRQRQDTRIKMFITGQNAGKTATAATLIADTILAEAEIEILSHLQPQLELEAQHG